MTVVRWDDLTARSEANCRAAQACVTLGYGVIGWHYTDDGQKKPSEAWRRRGSTFPLWSVEDVRDWWGWRPMDYAGVVTGPESSVIVVDIDPRNGGAESLRRLEDRCGPLGEPTVDTPSGGWHYHFEYTTVGGLDIATRPLDEDAYPGIDIKAWGGFVGAPGAVTERGEYAVRNPSAPLLRAPLPPGLVDLLPVRNQPRESDWQPGAEVYDSSPANWIEQLVADAAFVRWGSQEEYLRNAVWRMRQSGRPPEEMQEVGCRIIAQFASQPGREPWTEQHVRDKVNRAMQKPVEVPHGEIPWGWVARTRELSLNGTASTTTSVRSAAITAQSEDESSVDPFAKYGDRLVRAGNFALDEPETVPAVWGDGERVLWSEGEALMIAGHQGLGKTTIAQQLVLHRAGIRTGPLLGLTVTQGDRPVLVLAMDRPRQFARSLRRMVDESQRAALNERVLVWRGPLPFNPIAPGGGGLSQLADFAEQLGAGTLVVDSVKDLAPGISKDEVGAALNSAWQEVIARGIELLLLHHERKAEQGNRRHNTLDDVYGSTWLTSGLGSVVVLEGEPGAATVGFKHLKQPAALVGPLEVRHDHSAGVSTLVEAARSVLDGLRAAGERGTTVQELAQQVYGETGTTAQRRISRELNRLSERSLALRKEGAPVAGRGRTSDRWFATDEAAWSAGSTGSDDA